jgi:ribosomal protein S20
MGELIGEDIAGFIGCDLNGLNGIDGLDGLGSLKSKLKNLKNKVESKVKTAVNKVESAAKTVTHAVGEAAVKAAKTVHEEAKKGLEVAETIAKKTIHIIAKVNPLGLVARNALLLLLQLNAFNLARKLSVGSGTLADAQSREYTESEYNRIKAEVTKCAKLFHTLGGEEKHFYDAINKGKNKRPLFGIGNKNVSGLGVISEASITAASGIIAGISSIIKPILSLFKKKDAGDPNDKVTSYPHTNPDGSILLNADGDISYPDGSKYIAKPTDGKPYFQKSDGTKEYDKDEIIQEQESEHDKLSNDLLKAHGESTTDDGKSKSNVIWYIGGAAAVAAGIFVITR